MAGTKVVRVVGEQVVVGVGKPVVEVDDRQVVVWVGKQEAIMADTP